MPSEVKEGRGRGKARIVSGGKKEGGEEVGFVGKAHPAVQGKERIHESINRLHAARKKKEEKGRSQAEKKKTYPSKIIF